MERVFEDSHIQNIADAIRAKNGSTNTYKTSEMASAIEAIKSAPRIVTGNSSCALVKDGEIVTITGIDTNGLIALYLANVQIMPAGTSKSKPDAATMFINIAGGKLGYSKHYLYTSSGQNYSYSESKNATIDADITVDGNSITIFCDGFRDDSFVTSGAGATYGWIYTAIYSE